MWCRSVFSCVVFFLFWVNFMSLLVTSLFFFFFQAEDGIRDHCVTGVQTCALPISLSVVPVRLGWCLPWGRPWPLSVVPVRLGWCLPWGRPWPLSVVPVRLGWCL